MTDLQQIVILGTGGNCIDILDAIHCMNERQATYECIGFLDDHPSATGSIIHGVPVLGPLSCARELAPNVQFVNGIGSTNNYWYRREIIDKVQVPLERFATIVHPSACISKWAAIGKGVVVLPNVTIAANTTVGNHVTILANSVINHDCVIGDYTCIASGVCVSGGVDVGNSCYLGSNCSIMNNISIGDYSLVGMGSCVLRSVPAKMVVAGNPAKVLRSIGSNLV